MRFHKDQADEDLQRFSWIDTPLAWFPLFIISELVEAWDPRPQGLFCLAD